MRSLLAMGDRRLEGTEIAPSVIDLIGNTPLVRLKRLSEVESLPCVLAMKLETTNPGGSSKDRPALEMILQAERDGFCDRAAPSSSRRAGTPASASPSSPPSAATGVCS